MIPQSSNSLPGYLSLRLLQLPPFSVCCSSLPIPPTDLHSVSSTPLCQSLHWLPFSVLHPSLPIPPLASIQCPPPLSANPSTDLYSVPSTPLCNLSTGLHSVPSTPLCQSLHWLPLAQRIKFKILTTYKAIHIFAPSYITNLVSKYQPNHSLRSSQDLLLSSSRVTSHARLQDFSRASPILWNSLPQSVRLSPNLSTFR
ncbi:unnamed protein product [Staurois parvus]|uniref:Uncharacterized protein n=1 Tax=Staurois parvus TaxID=386267 RepID=A0ABN9CU99_9NEOB|nr:unnamed protein product [Staurois parvus]